MHTCLASPQGLTRLRQVSAPGEHAPIFHLPLQRRHPTTVITSVSTIASLPSKHVFFFFFFTLLFFFSFFFFFIFFLFLLFSDSVFCVFFSFFCCAGCHWEQHAAAPRHIQPAGTQRALPSRPQHSPRQQLQLCKALKAATHRRHGLRCGCASSVTAIRYSMLSCRV